MVIVAVLVVAMIVGIIAIGFLVVVVIFVVVCCVNFRRHKRQPSAELNMYGTAEEL
jgi:heme/copper-type cytochrome/quinol oxidase subunit 2